MNAQRVEIKSCDNAEICIRNADGTVQNVNLVGPASISVVCRSKSEEKDLKEK
jgi:hypothetical protein